MPYMSSTDDLPPCPAPWIPPLGYEPAAPERIAVVLGREVESFNKNHKMPVSDILDALDGETARVWTTETHALVLTRGGQKFEFTDPDLNVTLEAGDEFEAVAL